ncbi:MAG: hypothetical protein LUQ59_01665 [Methanothrix sp.]|nr:hypothetical protein [Methanothrix sp.]
MVVYKTIKLLLQLQFKDPIVMMATLATTCDDTPTTTVKQDICINATKNAIISLAILAGAGIAE